jgi:aminopeptidase N
VKIFVYDKVQPLFDSLGVHNKASDTYFDRLARNVGIGWACYVGSPECLYATNNRLQDFILSGQIIEADVRIAVLCNGLRQAKEDVFLAILIKMTSTTDPLERNQLLNALGCSQNPDFLRSYLWSSLTTTDINTNERTRILNAVIQGGIVGVRAVLEFLNVNFAQTYNR